MTTKPMGSAAVVFDPQGRVILVKHTYGKLNWELPGGAAEPNESVEETAVREVREETGLHVVVERMVGRIYYDPDHDMHHFLFVCKPEGPQPSVVANSPEVSDLGYFAFDALPRPISDFTIQRIRDAADAQTGASVVQIGPRRWIL